MAFAPTLLLPVVQEVVRPALRHAPLLGAALGSAPDFVVGVCFPFSILVRPRAWTRRAADALFLAWCCLTLAALTAVEYLAPFGPNVFDPNDLLAGAAGVGLAGVGYACFLRRRLGFDAAE